MYLTYSNFTLNKVVNGAVLTALCNKFPLQYPEKAQQNVTSSKISLQRI